MNNVIYKPLKSILEVVMESEDQAPYNTGKSEQHWNKNVHYRVLESDLEFRAELYAAGYQKSDFEILLEKDQLIVSTHTDRALPQGYELINSTIPSGSIYKVFRLNQKVDRAQITAKYEDGVLSISLPKDAKSTASMKIVVN